MPLSGPRSACARAFESRLVVSAVLAIALCALVTARSRASIGEPEQESETQGFFEDLLLDRRSPHPRLQDIGTIDNVVLLGACREVESAWYTLPPDNPRSHWTRFLLGGLLGTPPHADVNNDGVSAEELAQYAAGNTDGYIWTRFRKHQRPTRLDNFPAAGNAAAQLIFTTARPGGVLRAVLIGNQTYQYQSNIEAAITDAESLQTVLRNRFPAWQTAYMAGRAPVRTNRTGAQLEADLRGLLTAAQDNDIAVFYYSGHGIRRNADSVPVDEADSRDEALAGVDWDSSDPAGLFTDDEFKDAVSTKKPNTWLVVLLEACHSGGKGTTVSALLADGQAAHCIDCGCTPVPALDPPAALILMGVLGLLAAGGVIRMQGRRAPLRSGGPGLPRTWSR